MVDAAIVGVMASIALAVAGVPYAVLIGVCIGFGNLIPYFGPVVGYAAVVIVCLTSGNFTKMLIGLVIIAVIMFVDGNIINPRLLSENVDVHPLLVVAALLGGGVLGGIAGMLINESEEMKEFLRAEFAGECSEVGMYLAMSRAAIRQGYPEVGAFYRQAAFEEADHASRYAEMLGEVVSASTKENLEARVAAENGACAGKTAFAKKCKEMGLDALHDSIHEMARDEAILF